MIDPISTAATLAAIKYGPQAIKAIGKWSPFGKTGFGNMGSNANAFNTYMGAGQGKTGEEAYQYASGYKPQGEWDAKMLEDLLGKMRSSGLGNTPTPATSSPYDFDAIYNQALKAYDPASIAKIYANAFGQLGRNQGSAVAGAQRTGAMQAASGSLANPGAFVMGAGQNARAPYAEAFANLGQAQSQAQMSGAKGLTDITMLINRAKQNDKDAENELKYRYDAP